MAGREPEDDPLPLVRHAWRDVTFLHWPVPVEAVRDLVPPRLDVDTFDRSAWVTLTPFRMVGVPVAGTFGECNVRTYVRGPDGRDGIWFLTLEAAPRPLVAAARLAYGVPYRRADVRVAPDGGAYVTTSRRSGVGIDLAVRVGVPIDGDELDHWLTGRWRAYGAVAGHVLTRTSVRHPPWPLRAGTVERLRDTLTPSLGLAPLGPPARVHTSEGVEVALGPPVPVGLC